MSVEDDLKNSELLPCPFCGSNATASDEFNEDGYWSAFCRRCKSGTAWHPQKANAIKAWNTRAHYGEGEQPEDNPHKYCREQDGHQERRIQRLVNATGEETVIAALEWIRKARVEQPEGEGK